MSARRSVDWRDSGIVIDGDHSFTSIEAFCDFNLHSSTSSNVPFEKIISDQDDDGDTFLHLAVVGCALEKVNDLIKICDLNAINNMMQTPLHVATMANRPEMVELLINKGAKLDIPDRRGNTPLHLACQKGYKAIAAIILDFLSTTSMTDTGLGVKHYLEMANFDGQTCLHLAALHDRREIIEMLVSRYNADLNCRDSRSGDTILHKAILNFNIELVDFILKLGKLCHQSDYSGRRPSDTIRMLRNSVLDKNQIKSLDLAAKLIDEHIQSCTSIDGSHALEQYKQVDELLDSSSSDYSDSDSDMSWKY